jgi:hypothetical protein
LHTKSYTGKTRKAKGKYYSEGRVATLGGRSEVVKKKQVEALYPVRIVEP